MRFRLIAVSVSAALVILLLPSCTTQQAGRTTLASESRVSAGSASIYTRVIGRGQPMIVLHGGPDFDSSYLLPEMDRFEDQFRLIFYDQRGRGQSADNVRPEDVTIESEVEDLDKVRQHYRVDSAALLGHSWGTVLALEYALRHPARVSHLILMNPAPASTSGLALMQKSYLSKVGSEMARQREIAASPEYRQGDPATVTARYRIHFRPALTRSNDYEKLMTRMDAAFMRQGKEGILKARAVEDQLMLGTWQVPGYDLLPKLRDLRIPTLIITGADDFIPIEVSEQIARAIPGAELVKIKDCGHFAYLECADDVSRAFKNFFRRSTER